MKGDLAKAKTYADKVIRSNKFRFTNLTTIGSFMQKTISLDETIWGLYNAEVYSDWYTQHINRSGLGDIRGDFADIYKDAGPAPGSDYRRTGWFGTHEKNGVSRDICVKMMGRVTDTTSLTTSYSGGAYLGTSMIRIPEMYYIMAEALLDEGDASGARWYLDTVVSARGMVKFADRIPAVEITLDDIMAERRKELFGEGQWWFCLKRLNSSVKIANSSASIPGSDKIYALPLPTEEEDYRPNE